MEAIIPRENEKDLPDIPDAIKKTMKLNFVDSMDQVLKIALEREIVSLPMPAAARTSARSPPGRTGRTRSCGRVRVFRAGRRGLTAGGPARSGHKFFAG